MPANDETTVDGDLVTFEDFEPEWKSLGEYDESQGRWVLLRGGSREYFLGMQVEGYWAEMIDGQPIQLKDEPEEFSYFPPHLLSAFVL